MCWAILINTLHHFTVGAIIKTDLLVALKFFTSHLLSNYKYFSEMYILVIIIALLLHCAVCLASMRAAVLVQWSLWCLAENRKAEGPCTADRKMEIFPWLSNIYRWRVYLWNVSYVLRKTAHLRHIEQCVSLSGTRPFCLSIWRGEREPL